MARAERTTAKGEPRDQPLSVLKWFAGFTAAFLLGLGALVAGIATSGQSFADWQTDPLGALEATDGWVKLLALGLYISLCCTFLPLPTTGVVAAAAVREVAVADGLLTTALSVGLVAGAASMIANLNDYHAFVGLLRHKRIAAVRGTRGYVAAAKWFERSPGAILALLNLVPLPVDIPVRMLAAAQRYSRVRFAAANFAGRFVRYAVVAGFIYAMGQAGWPAVAVLIALAAAGGLGRWLWRRFGRSRQVVLAANLQESELSSTRET